MVEIKSQIIKEFIYKSDIKYVVYIKETINSYEAYLQNEDCGVISLMFGIDKNQTKLDNFIIMVNDNLQEYIELYKQDYED